MKLPPSPPPSRWGERLREATARSRPSLVELTSEALSHIDSHEGFKSERNEARQLASYLISTYNFRYRLPTTYSASPKSHKRFEHFLRQINNDDPSLKFLEINDFNELDQPDQLLTRFCDKAHGVDIRLCKLPHIPGSLGDLVRGNNYSYISHFDGGGWGLG